MDKKEKSDLYKYLHKDVKEFNKYILSLVCIGILVLAGLLSYFITTSYAYFTDTIVGKKTIEATVSECNDNNVNSPVLDSAMIPVYYDETSSTWKKADSTNKSNNWYDYCKKKWANSVTVSSTNRSKYQSASVGTEIPMDDILTMEVWIPRYKYKVFNYNADGTKTSSPQEIEITFEKGTTTTGEISCQDAISATDGKPSETCKLKSTNATCTDDTCNNKTYTHPAFTFGNEEIKGFWIGKYELTGTIDNITTKPNLSSLVKQSISNFETNIMKMNDSNNVYGISTNTDTHMIKNIEWGAVAYLSHSKYGTCTNGVCVEVVNKASTTGNVYGIYNMSGGIEEATMGNLVSNDGSTMLSGNSSYWNSGYTGKLYDNGDYTSYTGIAYPNAKYYDKYSLSTSAFSRIISKLGDGIKEVYIGDKDGWYSNISALALVHRPWFARGGSGWDDDSVFTSSYEKMMGGGDSDITTRLIITPQS